MQTTDNVFSEIADAIIRDCTKIEEAAQKERELIDSYDATVQELKDSEKRIEAKFIEIGEICDNIKQIFKEVKA